MEGLRKKSALFLFVLVGFNIFTTLAAYPGCPGGKLALTVPPDYDKTVPDYVSGGDSTFVLFSFDIVKMLQVDEERGTITLQVSMNLRWNDSRVSDAVACSGELEPSAAESIWKPDIYFYYSASTTLQSTLHGHSEALMGSPEGFRWWLELNAGLHCAFDFTYYPFDAQRCKLMISSMSTPLPTLQFDTWRVRDFTYKIQQKTQYHIEYAKFTEAADLVWESPNSNSKYALAGFHVTLARQLHSSLANTFLPSFLTVITCSISFWIPQSSIPGRMALLITSYLVLTNMHASKYTVFTAIDGWMYVCKVFVIAAMLEFAWLLRLMKKAAKRANKNRTSPAADPSLSSSTSPTRQAGRNSRRVNESGKFGKVWDMLQASKAASYADEAATEQKCRTIDGWAFIVFNSIFLAFCALYAIVLPTIG